MSTSYLIPFENVVANTQTRKLHAREAYGLCEDRERSLKIVYSSYRAPLLPLPSRTRPFSAPSALFSQLSSETRF